MSLPLTNYQAIPLPQDNVSSIHGLFSVLKELNGKYKSRYTIDESTDNTLEIDSYFDVNHQNYISVEDHFEITFRFNSSFLLTGYAIANAAPNKLNSYPTAWNIFGIDNHKNRHLLDSQSNQTFCESLSPACTIETIKGYQIRKQFKAFNNFVFQQTANSDSHNYVFLKAIDFYGRVT